MNFEDPNVWNEITSREKGKSTAQVFVTFTVRLSLNSKKSDLLSEIS